MVILFAFFASFVVPALALTLPSLDPAVGCNKGSSYVKSSTYGVSSSRWGHLSRGGWRGAVRVNDKIYGIPCNATSVRSLAAAIHVNRSPPHPIIPTHSFWPHSAARPFPFATCHWQVLEIDPVTRSVSTFGALGPSLTDAQCSGSVHCGDEKWIGGVHIPGTNKIIAIPYAAETVLEIDTEKRTTSTFGIVSSSVKRKWVDGVLGRNGLIYAIPYDADVVLEIDPETRALMLFGRVGGDPCKWYGGVLAPNGKIYAIPYSSPYVLEIDTERRIARPFAMTYPHWAKWSGGVLAPNGKIYGIPALSKSVLEIDVEKEQISLFGMLPGGDDLQDKWGGGVLAPNGKIYGLPWRSSSVLEFDPTTKAIALLGQGIGSSNFSWSGGVLANDGRIVAVPYNGAWVLEIGESICTTSTNGVTKKQMLPPLSLEHLSSAALTGAPSVGSYTPMPAVSSGTPKAPTASSTFGSPMGTALAEIKGALAEIKDAAVQRTPETSAPSIADEAPRTFVLALLGCPDESKATEDACFHLAHRTWHSAMVTIMRSDSTLHDIREQVLTSRLSHVPTNFCFLFNGHALDPNVEATIKAYNIAIPTTAPDTKDSQSVVLIDNIHCVIGPKSLYSSITGASSAGGMWILLALAFVFGIVSGIVYLVSQGKRTMKATYRYDRVPGQEVQEAQSLIDPEASSDQSDKAERAGRRIPCFPHAHSVSLHLRPMLKPARLSPYSKSAREMTTVDTGSTHKK